MENIQAFLQGAAGLGLPTADSFMTVDLYEEKNINQVVLAIHSLGRHSRKIQGYTGPSIGPKLADKHEVNFTDEQLKKGQTELNYSQSVQKESQKIASEATKPQMDSIVRVRCYWITIVTYSMQTKQTGAPKWSDILSISRAWVQIQFVDFSNFCIVQLSTAHWKTTNWLDSGFEIIPSEASSCLIMRSRSE